MRLANSSSNNNIKLRSTSISNKNTLEKPKSKSLFFKDNINHQHFQTKNKNQPKKSTKHPHIKNGKTSDYVVVKEQQTHKQFKDEDTIRWKGFVLTKNRLYESDFNNNNEFYCEKCDVGYNRIYDFISHCLNVCRQIQSSRSSHKIFSQRQFNLIDCSKKAQLTQSCDIKNNTIVIPEIQELQQVSKRFNYCKHIQSQSDEKFKKFLVYIREFTINNISYLKDKLVNNLFYTYQNNQNRYRKYINIKNLVIISLKNSSKRLFLYKNKHLRNALKNVDNFEQTVDQQILILDENIFYYCLRQQIQSVKFKDYFYYFWKQQHHPQLIKQTDKIFIPKQMNFYFKMLKRQYQQWTLINDFYYYPDNQRKKSKNKFIRFRFKLIDQYLRCLSQKYIIEQQIYCPCNWKMYNKDQFFKHVMTQHETNQIRFGIISGVNFFSK